MSAGASPTREDDARYLSNDDRVDALRIGVCDSLIMEEIEEADDFSD
jgi:hypothetical protein